MLINLLKKQWRNYRLRAFQKQVKKQVGQYSEPLYVGGKSSVTKHTYLGKMLILTAWLLLGVAKLLSGIIFTLVQSV